VPYTVPKLKSYTAAALDKAAKSVREELHRRVADLAAAKVEGRFGKAAPDVKAFRDEWMARTNGVVTQLNQSWLKPAPPKHKRDVGKLVNELREHITEQVGNALEGLRLPGSRTRAFSEPSGSRILLAVSTSPSPASGARSALNIR